MKLDHGWRLRLAVLSTLVKQAPQTPGRTALMKFAYFLQTLRGVPLGYRFELYNYGPYDGSVLSDLSQAATLKAVKSEIVHYPGGYGYEYSPRSGYESLRRTLGQDIERYEHDIVWVLDRFGTASAARLELLSTIVFAEREMRRKRRDQTRAELRRRVKGIKPHFEDHVIESAIDELGDDELIEITDE
jgi:uncharacterized protein YwgA